MTDFMDTLSGKQISILAPQPEDYLLEDIAHHLAMQVRRNGAVPRFYSVAEHSTNVTLGVCSVYGGRGTLTSGLVLAPDDFGTFLVGIEVPPDLEPYSFWGALLRAHLHDAAETALGDCISPLKRNLPEYQRIEALHMAAVHAAFGFSSDDDWSSVDGTIHQIDTQVYVTEYHVLCNGPEPFAPLPVSIDALDWQTAKDAYLAMAHYLISKWEACG